MTASTKRGLPKCLVDSYLKADGICPEEPASLDKGSLLSLDLSGCLSLEQIIHSFSSAIREEHAYAIIYECCQCLHKLLSNHCNKIYLAQSLSEVQIHKDGRVHESTYATIEISRGSSRPRATSVEEVLYKLASVVYNALDYGYDKNEERGLSEELEGLLELMFSFLDPIEENLPDHDEGIEQDHDDQQLAATLSPDSESLKTVIDSCASHLSVSAEAGQHYRNVCRALVSEALNFSSFLQYTKEPGIFVQELSCLEKDEWAELWQNTMHELRQGVRLKKTKYTKTPIEFALTPYEMLMDDIRSRRYKLKSVMKDGRIPPRVKKSAHEIILDYIRSRPPLKPVSERQLAPRKETVTPRDQVLQSIRSGEGKESLRKTSGPPEPKPTVSVRRVTMTGGPVMKSAISVTRRNQAHRSASLSMRRPLSMSCIPSYSSSGLKRIIPDPSFAKFDPDDESDEDEETAVDKELDDSFAALKIKEPVRHRRRSPSFREYQEASKSNLDLRNWHEALSDSEGSELSDTSSRNLDSIDGKLRSLDTHFSRYKGMPLSSLEQPLSVDSMLRSERIRKSCVTSRPSLAPPPSRLLPRFKLSLPAMTEIDSQSRGGQSATSGKGPEATVDLFHHELVHIRSMLSRAKLDESLGFDENLRQDVETSKICYLCRKTKFGFFAWSHTCKMCQHAFCSSCVTKVKIRPDFFSKVPIDVLTPQSPSADTMSTKSTRSRNVSVPAFSATHSVAQAKRHSTFFPTLSERVDSETIVDTPKRISFIDTTMGNAAARTRLKRSQTLGRVDTHVQAQALRRPLPSNRQSPISPIMKLLASESNTEKWEQVCLECKDVIDRAENSDSESDTEDVIAMEVDQERTINYKDRRLRQTKSLIYT